MEDKKKSSETLIGKSNPKEITKKDNLYKHFKKFIINKISNDPVSNVYFITSIWWWNQLNKQVLLRSISKGENRLIELS